jgi:hypothetical protein
MAVMVVLEQPHLSRVLLLHEEVVEVVVLALAQELLLEQVDLVVEEMAGSMQRPKMEPQILVAAVAVLAMEGQEI